MLKHNDDDWYQILVDQSRTDHIYDLIHEGLKHDFEPAEEAGFVLLNPRDMPPGVSTIPLSDIAKTATELNEDGMLLLLNDRLTDYLEKAVALKVYEGLKGEYALLVFKKPQDDRFYEDNEGEKADFVSGRYLLNDDPQGVADKDDSLMQAWTLISRGEHKELALELATKGHTYLDKKRLTFSEGPEFEYVRILFGYHIVSVAYAWNDHFEEAAITDSYYIRLTPFYKHLENILKPYLEMLIAKKQAGYLEYLFSIDDFKAHFLPHYEAYISLLVNPHYECSRMREMVPIINRVNNELRRYL